MRVLGYSLNIHYTVHIRQRVAGARLSPREGDAHSSDYVFFCPPHYADSGEKGINLITRVRAHALSNALASDNLRARLRAITVDRESARASHAATTPPRHSTVYPQFTTTFLISIS